MSDQAPSLPCPNCDGRGYTETTGTAHDPRCDGSCAAGRCPVPVRETRSCRLCGGGGVVQPAPSALPFDRKQMEKGAHDIISFCPSDESPARYARAFLALLAAYDAAVGQERDYRTRFEAVCEGRDALQAKLAEAEKRARIWETTSDTCETVYRREIDMATFRERALQARAEAAEAGRDRLRVALEEIAAARPEWLDPTKDIDIIEHVAAIAAAVLRGEEEPKP